MTKLTPADFTDFWIRVYLGPKADLLEGCVDRAYRDFNRTLHGIRQTQSKACYQALKNKMISIAIECLTIEFASQQAFDSWHRDKCNDLKIVFKHTANHNLYIGQAQKWINMTLKYLLALGNRVNGADKNCRYFHIPIDNIILGKLKLKGIQKFKQSWSRVDSYQEYLDFQTRVRQTYKDELPIEVEFRLYNQ